jgi:hypothetical protein
MPRTLDEHERNLLETMIDQTSVASVVSALSAICAEKAEHISGAWQDRNLSDAWARVARQLEQQLDFVERHLGE